MSEPEYHAVVPDSPAYGRYVMLALFLGASAIYFPWRLTVFGAPTYSAFFFGVELIGAFWGVVYLLSVLHLGHRATPPHAPDGLAVDVLIPTYNEPVAVLRRTLVAALRIRYPHETWLLDDGNRPEMRALATELGCRYLAREKNVDAKAGNLNHGLQHAKGEFVLLLDADFIAAPQILDQTLGYFSDAKVSFVQTPQEFYNFDSYQHVGKRRAQEAWSEHSLFYRVIQRGRDRYNAAMFCGCAAILRRAALDDVGGIATGTVTEDMHTSVRLHAAGWYSVFHPHTMAIGLAPHNAHAFLLQRLRWAQGAMQIMRREALFSPRTRLSFGQRAAYLMHIGTYMEGPRILFLYLMGAITLLLHAAPMQTQFGTWALYTLPYMFCSIAAYELFSRGYGRIIDNEVFNLARTPAYVHSLTALFTRKGIAFRVTPKMRSNSDRYLFPWLVLGANLLAVAVTIWDALRGDLFISGWPLVMVLLWTGICCIIAARVCLLTRRCNRNRRNFCRFPATMALQLLPVDMPQACIPAQVTDLSDEGISLRHAAGGIIAAGQYTALLRVNHADLPITLTLREGSATGGALQWSDVASQDLYHYLLLTERIHFLADNDGKRSLKMTLGWRKHLPSPVPA